jgi:hypothetical protein
MCEECKGHLKDIAQIKDKIVSELDRLKEIEIEKEKALILQYKEYMRRLDELNKEHVKARDLHDSYMSKELYKAQQERFQNIFEADREEYKKWKNKITLEIEKLADKKTVLLVMVITLLLFISDIGLHVYFMYHK